MIVASFLKNLADLTSNQHFCIAYSGGLDSRVLLACAVKLRELNPGYSISAVHVHHGINADADKWVEHCQQVCDELRVPLTVYRVDGRKKDGLSPEAVAREARFGAFTQHLGANESLLLGQHADDQAETILLRLFRGAGPLGLGGMQAKTVLGKGELLRPFLSLSKADLLEYARANGLSWIEDESNTSYEFDRNFLRHEIMPALKQRWPQVDRAVNRSGKLCVEVAHALQALANEDLEKMQIDGKQTLDVSQLLALSSERRLGVIRVWLQRLGFAFPSFDHMHRIDREVLQARPGAKPRLKIGSYEISRAQGHLHVLALKV